MGKVRHVDFYADEWLAGTATLSAVEIGVYISACAMIYSRGGPIEKDELRKFLQLHGKAYENAIARLVKLGKLTLKRSQIASKRCLNELEKARKRTLNASQNGSKGGRPRKEINNIEKAGGFGGGKVEQKTNYQPPTTNHQPDSDADASGERARAPKPPPEERKNGSTARKTAILPDWKPDERDRKHAHRAGYDDAWIDEQADRFRDRCLRDGAVYANWNAAWRTWVGRAEDFATRDRRPNGTGAAFAPQSGPITAAIHAIRDRRNMV